MRFEWDVGKSHPNRDIRGFDFAVASGIFKGTTIEVVDARPEYRELRIRAIGETNGIVLVVIFTDRAGVRRIISARTL